MSTPTAPRTFSTDPGWYTDSIPEGVPTMTLRRIYDRAREAYFRAGGHNFAAQMKRVMDNVEIEMLARGFILVLDNGVEWRKP
jgi:xylose isomerase